MNKIKFALLISVIPLLNGCLFIPRNQTIPDQRIPHRIAEPVTLEIWVRQADHTLVKESVSVPAGWWIAGPQVVEAPDIPR